MTLVDADDQTGLGGLTTLCWGHCCDGRCLASFGVVVGSVSIELCDHGVVCNISSRKNGFADGLAPE